MKKNKIVAAIASLVMAISAMPTFSVSAISYHLPKSDTVESPVIINNTVYTAAGDDVDKYIEEFSVDDEASKLLEEYFEKLKEDGRYYCPNMTIHILKLPMTKTIHNECPDGVYWSFIEQYDGFRKEIPKDQWDDLSAWSQSGEPIRVLKPDMVLDPTYWRDYVKEDILPVEEFEKMSYEERVIFTVNYYLEHGEYLSVWGAEELGFSYESMSDDSEALMGDANCDGETSFADAVCIMQHLANPAKYPITEQGIKNANMDGNGITADDALKIQLMVLGIISK